MYLSWGSNNSKRNDNVNNMAENSKNDKEEVQILGENVSGDSVVSNAKKSFSQKWKS